MSAAFAPDARVLVLGADTDLVDRALALLGPDGEVIVLEASVDRLERFVLECRDPRVWYQLGAPTVLPLPDETVDVVVGAVAEDALPEFTRVLRPGGVVLPSPA